VEARVGDPKDQIEAVLLKPSPEETMIEFFTLSMQMGSLDERAIYDSG
jgi:hypothetical protein